MTVLDQSSKGIWFSMQYLYKKLQLTFSKEDRLFESCIWFSLSPNTIDWKYSCPFIYLFNILINFVQKKKKLRIKQKLC